MADWHRYEGSCHCGALSVVFESRRAAAELPLRACACGFCRRHGVRAVSDSEGRATILVRDATALRRYRFGLRTADFVLCEVCGCYLGAMMTAGDGAWATLNVNCLNDRDAFGGEAPAVSYDHEDEAGRVARRRAGWTPAALIMGEG